MRSSSSVSSEIQEPCAASALRGQSSGDTAASEPIFLLIPEHDPIELVSYYPDCYDYYSDHELQTKRWFVENVKRDWIIFDVGADVGCYSILFSRLAPEGAVYACEPTNTIQLLRRNLGHHRADNVRTLRTAVGAGTGQIEEDIYRIRGRAPERMVCDFTTIDDLSRQLKLERVDCIKIDAGGFDLEALQGAEQILDRLNPWIVVSLDHTLTTRSHSLGEALEWLAARGYSSAHVLDYHNYVLRRKVGPALPLPDAPQMSLTFEQRPAMLREAPDKGRPIADCFAAKPVLHGSASIAAPDNCNAAVISVPGPRWSYAASWGKSASVNLQGPLTVEIEITITGGEVGLGCVSPAMDAYLGDEVFVAPAARAQSTLLSIPDGGAVGHLMLRNADANGRKASARVHRIGVFRRIPASARPVSPLLAKNKRRLSLAECEGALSGLEPSPVSTSGDELGIDIVPVEELGTALGFRLPFVAERKVYRKGLTGFHTETDEAAIYAYIYRNANPNRHLEFGTWEGFGATLCARVCDAEIWTINLPEGESDAEGNPLYGSTVAHDRGERDSGRVVRGDSGDRIGWRYREAGFASRVHQILCDSREFDASQFVPGFFDTILIDGGHKSEVVTNDTNKALPLLRSGGIMIWHDFCPEVETLKQNEAPRGVVRAVINNFGEWSRSFSKIMWIRPSWMLLGVRL